MTVTPELALLIAANIFAIIYGSNKITSNVTARFVLLENNVKHIMRKMGMNARGGDDEDAAHELHHLHG